MNSVPSRGRAEKPHNLLRRKNSGCKTDKSKTKRSYRSVEARERRKNKRRVFNKNCKDSFKNLKESLKVSGLADIEIKLKLKSLRKERKSGLRLTLHCNDKQVEVIAISESVMGSDNSISNTFGHRSTTENISTSAKKVNVLNQVKVCEANEDIFEFLIINSSAQRRNIIYKSKFSSRNALFDISRRDAKLLIYH